MSQTPSASNRWLAYELHDGLLQWVIGAKLMTESSLASESANEKLAQINHFLELALSDGRSLIGFLEQSIAPERGDLSRQLRAATETVNSSVRGPLPDIQIQIEDGLAVGLEQLPTWNLYRITQQAVQNAVNHSGADVIKVICFQKNSDENSGTILHLEIWDDGSGFDYAEARSTPNHFGLASIEHRAKQIGATLQIKTAPGKGCSVMLDCPLSSGTQA